MMPPFPRANARVAAFSTFVTLGLITLAAGGSIAHAARAEQIWASLDRPREAETVKEPFGLVEVRGWAGTGLRGSHDVVIVIDRTASTFVPSGVDVDGDGEVGKIIDVVSLHGHPFKTVSDPDDTIAAAQLLAARRLIERLDSEQTRMGIVTFGQTERVIARLGATPDALFDALDKLPPGPERSGTYFYGAIMASIDVFEQAQSDAGKTRHRSIIFLSDGLPNEPPPPSFAEKAAVRASYHARTSNIRIYSFALGTEVASHPDVFLDMSKANGGELLIVEQPADIVYFVPHMSLTKLQSVKIENLTTGTQARAVRLFPDGTFDGYAPLQEGENLLRITVRGEKGGVHTIERRVLFTKTRIDTAEARRRIQELLKRLRIRTLETQLAEEARMKREQALERTLKIEVEREESRRR